MSKHWKPGPRNAWSGYQPHGYGRPRRRRRGFSLGALRLTVLGGIAAGLALNHLGMGARPDAADDASAATKLLSGPVHVIDGDTFDHAGNRIRIADIDTPEVRGQCAEEREMAAAATRRLRVLLASGPFELRRSGRDEDRYGRKLRVVMRGGRSIGDQLVAEGLARTWTGRRQPWC